MASTVVDRARGSLVGLAVGDALGTPFQFTFPSRTVTDMEGFGTFNLPPGHWTDDTSMALCLAESLLASGFDPVDQLERYRRWLHAGHNSSIDVSFDVGGQTRTAIERFHRSGEPYPGDNYPTALGNGSLMRLAPVPIRYADDPGRAIEFAGLSSRTTHGGVQAIDACRYFAGLIVGALNGASKDEVLQPRYRPGSAWATGELHPDVERIADGSFRTDGAQIKGSGYVLDTLEAALWALAGHDTFAAGALACVNLGDDTDTVAAVYGQLAGALLGIDSIPPRWREVIVEVERIDALAVSLAGR